MASSAKDILLLKDGQSLNGTVETNEFVIQTSFAKLKFKKKAILQIHFKSHQFPWDVMQLQRAEDRIRGEISPSIIKFKVEENGQVIDVDKTLIHTIVFLTSFQAEI